MTRDEWIKAAYDAYDAYDAAYKAAYFAYDDAYNAARNAYNAELARIEREYPQ